MIQVRYLYPLFILLILGEIRKIEAKCAIHRKCDVHGDISTCHVPDYIEYEPKNFTYSEPFQCPEFAGQPNCCDDDSNAVVMDNYKLVNSKRKHLNFFTEY